MQRVARAPPRTSSPSQQLAHYPLEIFSCTAQTRLVLAVALAVASAVASALTAQSNMHCLLKQGAELVNPVAAIQGVGGYRAREWQ